VEFLQKRAKTGETGRKRPCFLKFWPTIQNMGKNEAYFGFLRVLARGKPIFDKRKPPDIRRLSVSIKRILAGKITGE
jgi:hypothetical protein